MAIIATTCILENATDIKEMSEWRQLLNSSTETMNILLRKREQEQQQQQPLAPAPPPAPGKICIYTESPPSLSEPRYPLCMLKLFVLLYIYPPTESPPPLYPNHTIPFVC